MANHNTTQGIQADIAKGWKPNMYLTNMSQAYFAEPSSYVAPALFPICPVQQSTGYFYTFDKGDLARDNVQRKPLFGKVNPTVVGTGENTYSCKVDQVIFGIDQITALDYQRAHAPGVQDPRKAKVRLINEQLKIHQDILFAKAYFQSGVWSDEWTTAATQDIANKTSYRWDDANFDPVHFFDDRKTDIELRGRRVPNKLALGQDAYLALKNHPDILERVKYGGSTPNPAVVNQRVLAEVLGFDELLVLRSTYNAARQGEPADLRYICDSKSALMCYTTKTPMIDEPSAGYIFTWDMLGNGSYTAIDQYEGERGTHSEYIEGLMATDMKKVGDDLATFFSGVVA